MSAQGRRQLASKNGVAWQVGCAANVLLHCMIIIIIEVLSYRVLLSLKPINRCLIAAGDG